MCRRPVGRPRAGRPDARPPPGCIGEVRAAAPRSILIALGDALAWLDRHVNLEAIESGRAGRSALPTLDRIRHLTNVMGDPQSAYPVLHVTGTNGKGSTVRMASALIAASGLSVGAYTSPHLERLNERMAWNGEPISDEQLFATLSSLRDLEEFALSGKVQPVAGGAGNDDLAALAPTWFELMTAAALGWFADVAVQAAVVEVGLGGRYDATNVCDAAVAAVTNVDLDHTDILGPTREDIAREKAGIVKEGSLLVLGEDDPVLSSIFVDEADRVGAAGVWRRYDDFDCEENLLAVGGRAVTLRTPSTTYEDVFLPLRGAHQGDNAAIAVAAVEAFFGMPLAEEVVLEGLASVVVPGRMEVVGHHPLVVLDGAHNAAGARVAGATLVEDFAAAAKVLVVMGCLRGRDAGELLEELGAERVSAVFACPAPSPRSQAAGEIADAARSLGLPAEEHGTVGDALSAALSAAGADDLVLVTGSLYVVGAARTTLLANR